MAVPPGGPIEICFSFDTTGSMSGSIKAVKQNVQEMIQRLQSDIPGIRMPTETTVTDTVPMSRNI